MTPHDAEQAAPRQLSAATVLRLPGYLRALGELTDSGRSVVSSDELAAHADVSPAKLRKDLSQLGSYGTRGVGYDAAELTRQLSATLGLRRGWTVVIVGAGNLGHALAAYPGFASRGFRVAALLDSDPAVIGRKVQAIGGQDGDSNDAAVRDVAELPSVVRAQGVNFGVIATPARAAQQVCDAMVAAGLRSILNFAPCTPVVPEGIELRKVDLALELQVLSFHEHQKLCDADRPDDAVLHNPAPYPQHAAATVEVAPG